MTLAGRIPLVALAALLAACPGDRAQPDAADGGSAAAAEEARQPEPEATRVLRDSVEAEVRTALPDAPPREEHPPPPAAAAAQNYQECMREAAAAASEGERALLARACTRLPGAP